MINATRISLRRIWSFIDRITPQLVAVCLLLGIYGLGWSYFQQKTNEDLRARQAAAQKQRIDDNTAFNECINRYTAQLSANLPPRTAASNARNAALRAALAGKRGEKPSDPKNNSLLGIFTRALANPKSVTPANLQTMLARFRHFAVTDDASLDAQAANPLPEAPSALCELPH